MEWNGWWRNRGRRRPESAVRAYLTVIDRNPEAVEMAVRAAWHRAGAAALTELLRFRATICYPEDIGKKHQT